MAQSWTTKVRESPVDELAKFRKQLPASGSRRLVFILARKGKALIQTRTTLGLDSSGKPFTAYSTKKYYAPKERRPPGYPKPSGGRDTREGSGKDMKTMVFDTGYAGYKSGIGRGSKPQLNVSGKMLGAISIAEVSPKVAVLYFAGREEAAKAHGHHFGTVVPKRPFFDLDSFKNRKEMNDELLRLVVIMAQKAKLEVTGRKR